MNTSSTTVLVGPAATSNLSSITVLVDLAWSGTSPPTFVGDVRSYRLLYITNLVLIAMLALVVLERSPRLLARIWSSSELFSGLFLHQKPLKSRRHIQYTAEWDWNPNHRDLSTDNSHNRAYHRRVGEKGAPSPSYPSHVSSHPALLRTLVQWLNRRFSPSITVGNVLVMVVYSAVLMFPAFYQSNPFKTPDRYGWIAVSQYPIALTFAAKNNFVGFLLGLGYEKLNFLHRFIGRMVVLTANIHALYYFFQWMILGIFDASLRSPSGYYGLIALICLDLLYFSSISFWRTNAYQLFLSVHVLSTILLIPFTLLHKPSLAPYVYTTLGIFLTDYLLRTLRSRWVVATIRPIPELGLTHIEIPQLNAGWRAGQHVRLRMISLSGLKWVEAHPFTIASVPGGPEGVVLMCKKAGDWTERMFEHAKRGGSRRRGRGHREEGGYEGVKVRVIIEGPYGGPGHTLFASFSAAVFVAGGSGITFALAATQDLIQKDLEAKSRVKVIELVWCVQDPVSLTPLLPLFTSMIQQSLFTPLRISVFYTRAPTGRPAFSEDFFRSTSLTLSPGRPKISKIVEGAINKTCSLGSGSEYKEEGRIRGLVLGVCGPEEMVASVYKEVENVDSTRREQVGGVEVYEETFGW